VRRKIGSLKSTDFAALLDQPGYSRHPGEESDAGEIPGKTVLGEG
jgi:hypothetical protein